MVRLHYQPPSFTPTINAQHVIPQLFLCSMEPVLLARGSAEDALILQRLEEGSVGPDPLPHPPSPLPPRLTSLFPVLTPVVVMAMESASASAPGVVAMEIPVRGALPVVEEDEGFIAPPGSEERLRYRRGGGRRRRGLPFNRGSYYMLIVIGEIGTEHQLDAARAQIER
ncbi:hypothetical protein INR49_024886, partial [Caranx melampygus]